GEYDDWIEIYNENDFPVDIGGLFVTDSLNYPAQFRIPSHTPDSTTISSGGYLVLWADNQEEQGVLHLNFKLSSRGEEIGISQPDGMEYIDSFSYDQVFPNRAFGLLDDGEGSIQIVSGSPGFPNFLNPTEKVFISEIVASGNEIHTDNLGEFDDWIEIYNDNDFEIDIGGMFMTDSIDHISKYRIPGHMPDSTTIGPKDYLILWADNQPGQGINHLGFKLSGQGEQLALVNENGVEIVDSVSYPNQYKHFSYSRMNNTGEWKHYRPSYSAANDPTPISGLIINEFMASNIVFTDDHGEYDDWVELHNTNHFPVDIGGLFITDNLGDLTKYRIPSHSPESTTITAFGYYLIYADNTDEQGVNHTNFRLNRDGEALALVHYDEETVLDSLTYSEQYRNSSTGRLQGSDQWSVVPPSPGGPNILPDFSYLMINEIMGFNKTVYGDEYNEYDDWIEFYNGGDSPLDIGGLFLSDSLADPRKFRISSEIPDSTTIQAGDYLILWADNTDGQGILHVDFKISKTGETIGIFNYQGELIDSVTYPFISPNLSWGRASESHHIWTHFFTPTPLRPNISTAIPESQMDGSSVLIYPNPVLEQAIFDISVQHSIEARIEIFNSKGMICSIMEVDLHGSGRQRVDWNVRDGAGNRLSSGLYYCRILTEHEILVGKFVIQ
ncbi:MAG: lamin tail domain-containing protein, partial [Bacteroidales bacterium]|nr:lamin tail domain-containing protein [Bacteroidales bacterium]